MPPSACWNRPRRFLSAPVKAPRTCPKSSDESSESGTAAQLTLTKGRALRAPFLWIARAISSLPVPLSPAIRTGRSDSITRSSTPNTVRIAEDVPMISL